MLPERFAFVHLFASSPCIPPSHPLTRRDVLPYIYTPTVGKACQEYHTLGIATRGLYLRIDQDK